MPPWQKARIEEAAFAPPPPRRSTDPPRRGIAAGAGTRITLSFRPSPSLPSASHGRPRSPSSSGTHHFCDHQLRGPFAYWHHCHRVTIGDIAADELRHSAPRRSRIRTALRQTRRTRPTPHSSHANSASTFAYRHARTSELSLCPHLRINAMSPHQHPSRLTHQRSSASPEPAPSSCSDKASPSPAQPPPSAHTSPAATRPCHAR